MKYAATGIFPAQSFFDINKNDGTISIIRDLRLDSQSSPTYEVSFKYVTGHVYCLRAIIAQLFQLSPDTWLI